jgi:hypothetical protein
MNNVIATQGLLEEEWVIAIEEVVTANPQGIAFAIEPIVMGTYDGENGLPCDPVARGYRKLGDCEHYVVGWKEGHFRWGELQELIDGIEDEEWMRGGMR